MMCYRVPEWASPVHQERTVPPPPAPGAYCVPCYRVLARAVSALCERWRAGNAIASGPGHVYSGRGRRCAVCKKTGGVV